MIWTFQFFKILDKLTLTNNNSNMYSIFWILTDVIVKFIRILANMIVDKNQHYQLKSCQWDSQGTNNCTLKKCAHELW